MGAPYRIIESMDIIIRDIKIKIIWGAPFYECMAYNKGVGVNVVFSDKANLIPIAERRLKWAKLSS